VFLPNESPKGKTVLHVASAGGHGDVVRHLLKRSGAKGCPADAQAVDSNGSLALHTAAARGHADVVGMLLDVREAIPYVQINIH
jgi:ankyrin repeat protein